MTTSAVSEVYRNMHVFLLVDSAEVRVVAMVPQSENWFMIAEEKLIYSRTFNSESEAEQFLKENELPYAICQLESVQSSVLYAKKGYHKESEFTSMYLCKVVLNYRQREPKFRTKKESQIYHRGYHPRKVIAIESNVAVGSPSEVGIFMSKVSQRYPNFIPPIEEKMLSPLKEKIESYLPYILAILAVGFLIGKSW